MFKRVNENINIIFRKNKTTSSAIRNFNQKWKSTFTWLINKENRAYCRYCQQSLPNNSNLLKRHDQSTGHVSKIRCLKN